MANTKIILDIQANIDQVKQAANEINSAFSKLNVPQTIRKSFTSIFSTLTKEIQNFEVSAAKGFETLNDVSKAQKNLDNINESFTRLSVLGKDISGIDIKKLLPDNLIQKYKSLDTILKDVVRLQKQDNSKAITKATTEYSKQEKKVRDLKATIEGYKKENITLRNTRSGITRKINNLEGEKSDKIKEGASKKEIDGYTSQINRLKKQYDDLGKTIAENQGKIVRHGETLKGEKETLKDYSENLKKLENVKINPEALERIREELAKIQGTSIEEIPKDIDQIKIAVEQAANTSPELERMAQDIKSIGTNAESAKQQTDQMGQSIEKEAGEAIRATESLNSEMDMLKTRLGYFFSIANGIQLFKRAINDAFESVKELDAAMAEMAVVTPETISELWKQMPEYAANARELGMTTLDVYKSMVLYRQQGLQAQQAQELSNQTLKMARIAGIEAADATDAMTSA